MSDGKDFSHRSYADIPLPARTLFTVGELVTMKVCPDPVRVLRRIANQRLSRVQEREMYPERWQPKKCIICGSTFERTRETYQYWQTRVVCSRKCEAKRKHRVKQRKQMLYFLQQRKHSKVIKQSKMRIELN